jgi:hypothetical protein
MPVTQNLRGWDRGITRSRPAWAIETLSQKKERKEKNIIRSTGKIGMWMID